MSPTVTMHELRIGMFVHLDLGWMSHPFPLSSFRIASEDQIATIRTLGLTKVRWAPEKSDAFEAADAERWVGGAGGPDGQAAQAAGAPEPAPAGTAAQTLEETQEQLLAKTQAQSRRDELAGQRAAAQLAEKQYGEAGRAWRTASDMVASKPEQARRDTEALTQALLDKMMGDGEMCVRLLTSQAGDRSTAHALNVAVISLLMGRTFGMSADEMLDLGVGALMHDVGKLDIADRLRHPDEQFSAAELNAYREHVALGVSHGRRMGMAPGALLVVAQHHENADGSGFPMKLGSERMTMAARIVSIVNRYDKLCNPPVLARALTPHESLSMLFSQSRNKYDTTVLNAFIRMMGVYPAGSVVQLTDDRHAMVVGVNSSRPLKPRVLVHDPLVPREEALVVNLDLLPDLGIRRSLQPARLPAAALEYLAPRPRVSYFFEQLQSVEPRAAELALACNG